MLERGEPGDVLVHDIVLPLRGRQVPQLVYGGGPSMDLVTGFPSPSLAEAVEAATSADGPIAVTPVFSASYSGLFKSFFDVIDNAPLTGKAVLAAATGWDSTALARPGARAAPPHRARGRRTGRTGPGGDQLSVE